MKRKAKAKRKPNHPRVNSAVNAYRGSDKSVSDVLGSYTGTPDANESSAPDLAPQQDQDDL